MNKLTIIMYHYVRDFSKKNTENIKGLDIKSFIKQLDFLQKNYDIIDPSDLILKKKKFNEKNCLLTFDDGHKDCTDYILPELKKRKLKGCFFPVGITIKERQLLDVHIIQHILARENNINKLVKKINEECLKSGISETQIKENYKNYAKSNAYDSEEIIYFKRMLQIVLPEKIRSRLLYDFFERIFNISRKEMAEELYMNFDEIKKLQDEGMYIGSHTYNHSWLPKLDKNSQKKEIYKSLEFLKEIDAPVENWIMCYPWGEYNKDTIEILKETGCSYGFTAKPGVADLTRSEFELSRKDTNEFIT